MREFQRHRSLENPEINKYRAGYSDCAREVARYLATPEPLPSATVPSLSDPGSKARLLRHLDSCVLEIDTEITSASSKDLSLTSRDYLRTPSTMNNTDCSQDSINPLDYSKINHDGINQALNLSKSVNSPANSQDDNNNFSSSKRRTSASPPSASDNFSSSSSSLASTNKQPPLSKKASNRTITTKKNKSDKSDESLAIVPPKKAMIKSVEKERRIAVNRMENVFDFSPLEVAGCGAYEVKSVAHLAFRPCWDERTLPVLSLERYRVESRRRREMINCPMFELPISELNLFSCFLPHCYLRVILLRCRDKNKRSSGRMKGMNF